MFRVLSLTLIVTVSSLSAAYADGIIFQLPKDGTWLQYTTEGKEVDAGDGDKEVFRGTVTLSSVGVETVKGEKCRWIEIRNTWQNKTRGDNDDRVRILKCLIPEKHLGKGKTPSKHVIRGWRVGYLGSKGMGTPYRVRDSKGSLRLSQPGGAFFGGPSAKDEKLQAKTISTKLGKFKCTGIRTRFEVGRSRRTKYEFTLTVWLNEKVPFGVVRFELKGKESGGDVVTMSGTVLAKGTGAETELPKNK